MKFFQIFIILKLTISINIKFGKNGIIVDIPKRKLDTRLVKKQNNEPILTTKTIVNPQLLKQQNPETQAIQQQALNLFNKKSRLYQKHSAGKDRMQQTRQQLMQLKESLLKQFNDNKNEEYIIVDPKLVRTVSKLFEHMQYLKSSHHYEKQAPQLESDEFTYKDMDQERISQIEQIKYKIYDLVQKEKQYEQDSNMDKLILVQQEKQKYLDDLYKLENGLDILEDQDILQQDIEDIENSEKKMQKKGITAEEIVDVDNYKQELQEEEKVLKEEQEIESEIKEINDNIKDKNSEIIKIKEATDLGEQEKLDQIEGITEDINRLHGEIKQLENQNLKKPITVEQEKNQQLQQLLQENEQKLQQLKENNKNLQSEIENLNNQLLLEQDKAQQDQKLKEFEEKQQKLEQVEKEILFKEDENKQIKNELKDLQQDEKILQEGTEQQKDIIKEEMEKSEKKLEEELQKAKENEDEEKVKFYEEEVKAIKEDLKEEKVDQEVKEPGKVDLFQKGDIQSLEQADKIHEEKNYDMSIKEMIHELPDENQVLTEENLEQLKNNLIRVENIFNVMFMYVQGLKYDESYDFENEHFDEGMQIYQKMRSFLISAKINEPQFESINKIILDQIQSLTKSKQQVVELYGFKQQYNDLMKSVHTHKDHFDKQMAEIEKVDTKYIQFIHDLEESFITFKGKLEDLVKILEQIQNTVDNVEFTDLMKIQKCAQFIPKLYHYFYDQQQYLQKNKEAMKHLLLLKQEFEVIFAEQPEDERKLKRFFFFKQFQKFYQ